jgi:hypothetical protein
VLNEAPLSEIPGNQMTADKWLIFLLSYYSGFLASFSNIWLLPYLTAAYSVALILLIFIFRKCHSRVIPANAFGPFCLMALASSIEYYHYLVTGLSIDGLSDIRMIIYNPLYSSILVFGLYATYLSISSDSCRHLHLTFSIWLFSLLNFSYSLLWFGIQLGAIPVKGVDRVNYLNNNHVSYIGLFAIFVLLHYAHRLNIRGRWRWILIAVNLLVMLLNTTRGALLITTVILFQFLISSYFNRFTQGLKFIAVSVAAAFSLFVVDSFNLGEKILGTGFTELYGKVTELWSEDSTGGNLEFERGGMFDDFSVSSVSRIFANYVGILYLTDNLFLGIGSARAYAIKVLSEGIHSFIFLFVLSTGLLGVGLLLTACQKLKKRFNAQNIGYTLIFLVLPILLFVNYLPPYFALIYVAGTPRQRPFFAAAYNNRPYKNVRLRQANSD